MIEFNASNFPKPSVAEQAVNLQASVVLLRRHFTHSLQGLLSWHFTKIDQAFLLWSALTLFIFSLGQFSTISWTSQAVLDAALTGMVISVTSGLTWAIAGIAKLRWVIFLWAGLISAGTIATAYGIFCGSALILPNLCLLWLSLCVAGYGVMAIGMKSRCFTAACWVHLAALALPLCKSFAGLRYTDSYVGGWQFFNSGLVIASTLFFFSVVPWDIHTR